jgi:hypothetical protein
MFLPVCSSVDSSNCLLNVCSILFFINSL